MGYGPDGRLCSPDTVLRMLSQLTVYTSESGKEYRFNTAETLNGLLVYVAEVLNRREIMPRPLLLHVRVGACTLKSNDKNYLADLRGNEIFSIIAQYLKEIGGDF